MEKFCRAGHTTDDNIKRRMCFAGWVTKAPPHTHTHKTHTLGIYSTALLWQQLLRERAPLLHCTRTYTACHATWVALLTESPPYLPLRNVTL